MDEQNIDGKTNSRLARNTVMMYIRMVVSILVNLFSTRIVLQALGVDDYGVYGIVAGFVVMLEFLNRSMSGATSRFLTFELGRRDYVKLCDTFNAAMLLHFVIALIVLLVAETIGLWFVFNQLDIPQESRYATQWVFQMSIISSMAMIIQTPFTATLFARESMHVYAFIEIGKSLLLLLTAWLLLNIDYGVSKLIIYAAFHCLVYLVTMIAYILSCRRKYPETNFKWRFSTSTIRPMVSFCLFDLFGNFCVAFRQYGINSLINIFFGVIYNTTSTIATMVNGALQGLTYSVVQAFRPQIIKQYAASKYDMMMRIMSNASQYSVLLMACMTTPLIIDMDTVLHFWLGDTVPPAATIFCRLLVLSTLWAIINNSITAAIHATGKIVALSLIGGSIFMISVPIVWLLYKLGMAAYYAYIVLIAINILILICDIIILKKQLPQFRYGYFSLMIIRTLLAVTIAGILSALLSKFMSPSLLRVVCIALANFVMLLVYTLTLVADKETVVKVKNKLWYRQHSR